MDPEYLRYQRSRRYYLKRHLEDYLPHMEQNGEKEEAFKEVADKLEIVTDQEIIRYLKDTYWVRCYLYLKHTSFKEFKKEFKQLVKECREYLLDNAELELGPVDPNYDINNLGIDELNLNIHNHTITDPA